MQSIRVGFALTVMLALFAASALAAGPRFTPVQGNVFKKVDAFDYFVDYSGSMMLGHKQAKSEKILMAQKVMQDINDLLPNLDYQAGIYTFAPYGAVQRNAKWERGIMAKNIGLLRSDLDVFGRMTDLGDGLVDHAPAVAALRGRKALIIASDGEVNRGPNPVLEARKLLEANPDLCLHVISVADTEEGQATLNAIAQLKGCSVVAKAADLIADDAAVRRFAEGVFYDGTGSARAAQPASAAGAKAAEQPADAAALAAGAAPVAAAAAAQGVEDVMVLRGVNFAFNSKELVPAAQTTLNEVAAVIKNKPGKRVLLNGYTDRFGSDEYNLALSKGRADSVKAYLVSRGVPADRMTAQGKGKSFTYDNNTEEGAYMNRRVEFVFAD